jgi:long-chain acyl-CoA synthetase
MIFDHFRNSYKNNVAVITHYGKRLSYNELYGLSQNLYSVINHRCLVFCLCQNEIGSLVGYVCFISNGIVPLMLDASLDKDLLDELIDKYNPEYLWIPKSRLADFQEAQVSYSSEDYVLIKPLSGKSCNLHSDLALLLTTSGSTGSPKLVKISYVNMESNAKSIAEYLELTEKERPITTMPMNYSFGLSIINSHFLVGATILLTSKSLMEKDFWAFLKAEKASSLSGVPYTFEMLKKLRFFRMELPELHTMTQAGGKLNLELNREFAEFCKEKNKRFFVMYGQTEATARMSYLPHEFSISKLGSMGWAIPDGEFMLVGDDKVPFTDPETTGELVYKGKNVSMGYAECASDLEKGDENKGILYTGDLAKKDLDNFYYIVGRKKRFIKLYGNRVNLDETERILKNIIPDCACIGEDDKMIVYITDHSKELEVQEYLTRKTAINSRAFCIKFIDVIPKNSSGKTIYTNLSLV